MPTPETGASLYGRAAGEAGTGLLAAALLRLFESVEQAAGIGSGERLQPVRLALLFGVTGHGPLGAKKVYLPLHLPVPAVLVKFADVHEHAHLRNGLKLRCAGVPHVSG